MEVGSDKPQRSLARDIATQTQEISRVMCFVISVTALFFLKGWVRLNRGCWMAPNGSGLTGCATRGQREEKLHPCRVGECLLFTFLQLYRTGTAERAWIIWHLGTASSIDGPFTLKNTHFCPATQNTMAFVLKKGPTPPALKSFQKIRFWTCMKPPSQPSFGPHSPLSRQEDPT